jgi:hypothetical protein
LVSHPLSFLKPQEHDHSFEKNEGIGFSNAHIRIHERNVVERIIEVKRYRRSAGKE